MKLQQLSVIFVIIILPIAMVIETYVNNLIDVSNKEKGYNTILYNSTYDSVRAYQINTLNNSFASVNTSRDRDISASVNSFFTSLASGFSSSGYTKNDLKDYIPAILFTLYDGYYIYGPYANSAYINYSGNQTKPGYIESGKRNIEYGVKPYTYYSCEYADDNNYDIIVNYTLDNYISVSGWSKENNNEKKYFTKAGYYINTSKIQIPDNDKTVVVKSDSNYITLKPEALSEYITLYDDEKIEEDGKQKVKYTQAISKARKYRYINYNEEKYYYDDELKDNLENIESKISIIKGQHPGANVEQIKNELINTYLISKSAVDAYFNTSIYEDNNKIPIFKLEGNLRIYINNDMLNTLANFVGCSANDLKNNTSDCFKDVNYYYYYKKAIDFTNSVKDILKNIDVGYHDGTYKNIKTEAFNKKFSIITRDGAGVSINKIEDSTNASESEVNVSHIKSDYSEVNEHVFDIVNYNNDPEMEDSAFNRHRMDVIISTVEDSLTSAIANFNNFQSSSYSYRMPTISEGDWYKVANNLSTIAFMQGLSVGNFKYYNNYAIVTNTKNKEFVSKNAIYVQDVSNSENNELTSAGNYHNPRCNNYNEEYYNKEKNNQAYLNDVKNGANDVVGYRVIDYDIQSFSHSYYDGNSDQKEVANYYLQPGTGAYECIVSLTQNYNTFDDMMSLKMGDEPGKTEDYRYYHSLSVEKAFVQALAREKNAEAKIYSIYND